jgi:hypothetical protein
MLPPMPPPVCPAARAATPDAEKKKAKASAQPSALTVFFICCSFLAPDLQKGSLAAAS